MIPFCGGIAEPGADLLPVDLARTRRFLCPVRNPREDRRTAGRCLTVPFLGFKILQCAVFLAWCLIYGNGSLWPPSTAVLDLGAALLIGGQILNISVFYRLGKVGVFYGNKLGYPSLGCASFRFRILSIPSISALCCPSGGFSW